MGYGSWDKYSQTFEMAWDQYLKAYKICVSLGEISSGESFCLVKDRDQNQRIYPSHPDACPDVYHEVCGPDDKCAEGGLNWTIWRDEEDYNKRPPRKPVETKDDKKPSEDTNDQKKPAAEANA